MLELIFFLNLFNHRSQRRYVKYYRMLLNDPEGFKRAVAITTAVSKIRFPVAPRNPNLVGTEGFYFKVFLAEKGENKAAGAKYSQFVHTTDTKLTLAYDSRQKLGVIYAENGHVEFHGEFHLAAAC